MRTIMADEGAAGTTVCGGATAVGCRVIPAFRWQADFLRVYSIPRGWRHQSRRVWGNSQCRGPTPQCAVMIGGASSFWDDVMMTIA